MISKNQIEQALNTFDAEKVHYVMTKLGWTWAQESHRSHTDLAYQVPSVESIRSAARELIDQLIKLMDEQPINLYRTYSLESGGICVSIWFVNHVALQFTQQTSMRFVPKLQIDFVVTQGVA